MLDSLYTEAIEKKDSISKNIEDLFEGELDIDEKWTNEKINPLDEDLILAAGDGSFNKKKYLGFYFYAVGAEALIYTPNEGLSNIETVELDTMPNQTFADERLRNMMSIFEIKTALKAFKEHSLDYYMVDGSLLGDLIRPIPLEHRIPDEIKNNIIRKIQKKLQMEAESGELSISPFDFIGEFEDEFKTKKDRNALITFFESIENLVVLKHFLDKSKKVIAISKTSTSTDVFHANVPDMAILDRFTNLQGYTKPVYKKVNSEVKHDFAVFNNSFRKLRFTIFFARLEDNRNIVKIELPYYANEREIKRVLGVIKQNSTDGYPFLLKRAHRDVVIKNKDMNNLSNIIEVIDKSGREMLD